MDEDLHSGRRQADPHAALVTAVDELHRLDLGEIGVGDDHLVHALAREHPVEVAQRSQRAQSICRQRPGREEAHDFDRRVLRVAQRMRHVADVGTRSHEHGAPAVAGGAQQDPGQPLIAGPQQ